MATAHRSSYQYHSQPRHNNNNNNNNNIFSSLFSADGDFAGFSFNELFKSFNLSEPLRGHLVSVYGTVALMLLTAFCGSVATFYSAPHPYIWAFVQFGAMLWFAFSSRTSRFLTFPLRSVLLMVISATTGVLLNPLLKHAIEIDEAVLPIALGSTLILFASFTVVAFKVERLSVMYYYAPIATLIGLLSFYSLISSLFGMDLIPTFIWTTIGMVMTSFFIILDTQAICLRFEQGDDDSEQHSLLLFLDFIKLFIRVLHIVIALMGNKKKEDRNKRQSRS